MVDIYTNRSDKKPFEELLNTRHEKRAAFFKRLRAAETMDTVGAKTSTELVASV